MTSPGPASKTQRSGRFSIIPARAIDDPRLGKAALLVLCALGTYSDRDGWSFPTVATLCKRVRLTRRPILTYLRQLQDLGYLESESRFDEKGSQRSNKFRILHDGDLPADLWEGGVPMVSTPPVLMVGTPRGANGEHPERTNKKQTNKHTSDSSPADQFEEFWLVYPKRTPHSNPRLPAKKKFEAAIKNGVQPDSIIRGAQNYARYVENEGLNPRYIAQAVTWLNQERWQDHQEAPAEPEQEVGPL